MEARITRVVSVSALLVGFWLLARGARWPRRPVTRRRTSPSRPPRLNWRRKSATRPKSIAGNSPSNGSAKRLPAWSKPCPIHAQVAPKLGAGGATSFVFDRGEVFGWKMNIQGSRERILDSVLPHEVTHTIFASYFRQPLPRWADEGACTTVEHRSEIAKQENESDRVSENGSRHSVQPDVRDEGIPAGRDAAVRPGPLACRVVDRKPRPQGVPRFLADGMKDENWPRAVQRALRLRQPAGDAELVERLGEAGPAAVDAGNVADWPVGLQHAQRATAPAACPARREHSLQSPDPVTPVSAIAPQQIDARRRP